jgi:cytoskeletal protein CcmA (bactofilin family)
MWDRKRSETATAPNTQPVPEPVRNAPMPAAAPPAAPREPVTQGSGTAIGKAVSIIGDIESAEDLYVDGEVKGNLIVKASRLTIGPNGRATSDVKAREVIIQGKVQGNVEATQKITIRREGSLVGNIKTAGIVIDDDAYFKGSIDIVRKESDKAEKATNGANG